MPKVIILQHVPCEPPGTIGDVLTNAGVSLRFVRGYAGDEVPVEPDAAAGLVVMGGPMGAYEADRYPFLRDELRLIERALRQELPVLGVCLGSQLVAAALGARVRPSGRKEIGWYPVDLSGAAARDPLWGGLGPRWVALHWHGDVFELPAGAVSLASSAMTAHQAFRFGASAYGILFHMEVTREIVQDMVNTFARELTEEGIDALALLHGADQHLPAMQPIGRTVFERWALRVAAQEAGR